MEPFEDRDPQIGDFGAPSERHRSRWMAFPRTSHLPVRPGGRQPIAGAGVKHDSGSLDAEGCRGRCGSGNGGREILRLAKASDFLEGRKRGARSGDGTGQGVELRSESFLSLFLLSRQLELISSFSLVPFMNANSSTRLPQLHPHLNHPTLDTSPWMKSKLEENS